MKIELITELPLWYLVFCVLLGLAYSVVLYYQIKTFSGASRWLIRTMAGLRFLLITLLAFLLLTPLLKTIFRELEKPIIIIAQDNSQSVVLGKDSAFYKNEYPQQLHEFIGKLQKKYTVKTLSFGDRISDTLDFRYNRQQTDFAELFDELYNRYSNRNLGAVVLASDGLYNHGTAPLYAAGKTNVPVYTVAMGDTAIRKDVVLTKINYNKIAFLGNNFPLEITADAKKCKGTTTELTITHDSAVVFKKTVDIFNDAFHTLVPVVLDAKAKGIQHYRIKLDVVAGENNLLNNTKDIFIEVLENKQKILLLADAPHPDISALKQSIETSSNYEMDVAVMNDVKPSPLQGDLKKYNLIIIHQLPSQGNPLPPKVTESKVSLLYILGNQSLLSSFNTLQTGLVIQQNLNKTNEVQPVFSKNFSLFSLSDETVRKLSKFPPLLVFYGNYKTGTASYILLQQQIGLVTTDYPLLLFTQNNDVKTGVLAGEGIWKWRLYDFLNNGSHDAMNEILHKTVQYLSADEDKRPFRIIGKNNFSENEPVRFDAELHDETFQLSNTPEVTGNIINNGKKNFPFTFSRTEKAYTLNAGYFPVGHYRYQASVKSGNKVYTAAGEFSVSPLQVELQENIADHQLLFNLARKHEGEMFYPSELDKLNEVLQNREDIKTVSYSQKRLSEIINLKAVFWVLLLLLATEWFLRKRNGGY